MTQTLMSNMKVFETTYELVREDFVYRITVGIEFVRIKRTKVDEPMWSHGSLTQGYDVASASFKPMILVDNMRLSLADADPVISHLISYRV